MAAPAHVCVIERMCVRLSHAFEFKCVVNIEQYSTRAEQDEEIFINIATVNGVHVDLTYHFIHPVHYAVVHFDSPVALHVAFSLGFADHGEHAPDIFEHSMTFDRGSYNSSPSINLYRKNTLQNHGLLIDDCLRIRLNIIFAQAAAKDLVLKPSNNHDNDSDALRYDLAAAGLRISGDVTIEVESQCFRAHSWILAARSKFFNAMLASQTQEGLTKGIRMADVSVPVFTALIGYMYTGKLEKIWFSASFSGYMADEDPSWPLEESWIALAVAADKYDLKDLFLFCDSFMCSLLSVVNFCKLLKCASTLRMEVLWKACIKFASSDTLWERVHDTLDFEHLGQNELLRLVLDRSGSTRKRKRENAHEKEFPDGTTWRRLSFSQLVRACAERNIRHSGERPSMIACLEHACGEDACGQDY